MSQAKQARAWLRRELGDEIVDPAVIVNRFGAALSERFGLTYGDVDDIIIGVWRELRGDERTGVDKFEWLRKVAAYPGKLHEHELRAAVALFEKCNDAIGLAWPSQETIALAMGGIDDRAAREAITRLEGKGFLERGTIADLPAAEKELMKRHGRGTYYALRLPSTVEIARRSVPEKLIKGKRNKRIQPDCGSPLQPECSSPLQPDCGSPPNNLGKTQGSLIGAGAPVPFSPSSIINRDVSSVEPLLLAPTVERE